MFYDADSALQIFLSSLRYDETTPKIPVLPPIDNGQQDYAEELAVFEALPRLIPAGCDVGMPPVISTYEGPKLFIDSFSTNDLDPNVARKMISVEYPLILTLVTSILSTPDNLLNKKTCGLILKAIARNTTLGFSNIRVRIPPEGTVRWGIMPNNRLNYQSKGSKTSYVGQIMIFITESDDM